MCPNHSTEFLISAIILVHSLFFLPPTPQHRYSLCIYLSADINSDCFSSSLLTYLCLLQLPSFVWLLYCGLPVVLHVSSCWMEASLIFTGPWLLSIVKDKCPRSWLALDVCEGRWGRFPSGSTRQALAFCFGWGGTHKYHKGEFFSLGLLCFFSKVGWIWWRGWILESDNLVLNLNSATF